MIRRTPGIVSSCMGGEWPPAVALHLRRLRLGGTVLTAGCVDTPAKQSNYEGSIKPSSLLRDSNPSLKLLVGAVYILIHNDMLLIQGRP